MKRHVTLFSIAILIFPLFWSCSEKETEISIASVTLSQPAAEMIVGETITLKATISPSNASVLEVIWASSKQSVASVDQSGKVVAIAEGTSTITATAGGKVGSCVVTVSKGVVNVSSINLDKTSASLKVGEKVTLTATVKPDDATDKTVTWSTSDASVATVDNGVVTAIKLGSATITAKAGDKEASCAIMVEATPVTSITLDKTSASLKVGEKVTLTATVKPDDATDKAVTWSTSDASVATVDNGVVTAIKLGSATITAKAGDKEATCAITVKATPVSSITLNKTSASLKVGETLSLTATVKPDDATDKTYTWSSSDNSVAAVDQNGKVTAKAQGNTVIKATANDGSGVFASCAVLVRVPYTAVAGKAVDLGLSVKWSSMNLGATSPTEYGDYFAWGETAPKENYSWETYEYGSWTMLTKYNTIGSIGPVDNKTEFKDYNYEDDAARQALGGKWRTPTGEEWMELIDSCTWTYTIQNGIKGILLTCKTNGNSIFLPAAGGRDKAPFNVGSFGFYWSSSLDAPHPQGAWSAGFDSHSFGWNSSWRSSGLPVRPVSE